MAITVTGLTSGGSTTDGTSFATASVTPSANKLILCTVGGNILTGPGTPAPPTSLSGNGLTWVKVIDQKLWESGTNTFWCNLSVWRAMGSAPSAGAITITMPVTQDSCAWSVVEIGNVDTSGTNGSGAVVQSVSTYTNAVTTITATLAAFSSSSNGTFGAFGVGDGTIRSFTPGTGFTEVHDTGVAFISLETIYNTANDTTVDSTASASTNMGAIALEIKLGGGSLIYPQDVYRNFLTR